jgi:hypothetical protein
LVDLVAAIMVGVKTRNVMRSRKEALVPQKVSERSVAER